MRYLLQALVIGIIALFAIALFAPDWIRPAAPQRAAPQNANANQNTEGEDNGEPMAEPLASTFEAATDPPESETVPDDAAEQPQARTKLVQSLKTAVQAVDEKLGPQADTITGQLEQTLDQADRILADAKQSNTRAMTDANRQQRLAGRSTRLLLVVLPGIDESCLGETSLKSNPALARMVAEGTRVTIDGGTNETGSVQTLVYGRSLPADGQIPPSLLSMLWHSGYNTSLIGDLSWAVPFDGDVVPRSGIERAFGWRTATEAQVEFPPHIWSNGVRVGIPANKGQQAVRADRIFAEEAIAQLAAKSQRPNGVIVVGAKSDDAQTAVRRGESQLAELLKQLDARRLASQTLLVVVGIAGEEQRDMAIVRWPGHVPQGVAAAEKCQLVDIAPTVLALTSSQRISKNWPGKSRAEALQAPKRVEKTPTSNIPAAKSSATPALPEA